MTFSLTGYDSIPIDGSGRVLITDINPTGDNNEDAIICHSEIDAFTTAANNGDTNWYLDPTEMSTDDVDRIMHFDPRGWRRNRDLDSGRRLVRLRRGSATAEEGVFEGVFTCHIPGDINTPRSVGVYYPSEYYPRRACAARLSPSAIRLSVTTFSATTRNKAAKKETNGFSATLA